MALIVEDGTGLADAESYCSVSFADTYHASRGNAAWAAKSSPEKEQALRRATDYMQQAYGARWVGYALVETQALSWPRTDVPRRGLYVDDWTFWPDDAVPLAVQKACAELALRAIAGDLSPDVGRLKKRTKVGEIEVEYADHAPAATAYSAVDAMLAEFLDGSVSGLSRPLIRA